MKKSRIVKYTVVISLVVAGFLGVYKISTAQKEQTEEEKNTREAAEVYTQIEKELQKEGTTTNEQLDKIIDEDLDNFPKEEAKKLKQILEEDRIEE